MSPPMGCSGKKWVSGWSCSWIDPNLLFVLSICLDLATMHLISTRAIAFCLRGPIGAHPFSIHSPAILRLRHVAPLGDRTAGLTCLAADSLALRWGTIGIARRVCLGARNGIFWVFWILLKADSLAWLWQPIPHYSGSRWLAASSAHPVIDCWYAIRSCVGVLLFFRTSLDPMVVIPKNN